MIKYHCNHMIIIVLAILATKFESDAALVSIEDISKLPFRKLHRLLVNETAETLFFKSLKTRQTKSLTGAYDFCIDDASKGLKSSWFEDKLETNCKKDNFYSMPVPSAFNDIIPNAGVRDFVGWTWYQTGFEFEADCSNRTIKSPLNDQPAVVVPSKSTYLQFDNVNYLALVWLDGSYLGAHVGGHLPFAFDATSKLCSKQTPIEQSHGMALKPHKFRLTIAVSNELNDETIPTGKVVDLSYDASRPRRKLVPNFDFFHYAGILGNVQLVTLPFAFITHVGINGCDLVYHKENDASSVELANLNFQILLNGNSELLSYLNCVNCKLTFELEHPNGTVEDHTARNILEQPTIDFDKIDITSPMKFSKLIVIKKSQLWEPANSPLNEHYLNYRAPLYTLIVKLLTSTNYSVEPTVSDTFKLRFGVKDFRIPGESNKSKFATLNNREIKLLGFGSHQEQAPSGRTMTLAAIQRDMYLLKWLGANTLRTSHYPYSEAFLDLADEHGIMLIAEAPAVGLLFDYSDKRSADTSMEMQLKLHKSLLRQMFSRDSSRASIIMWSIANEPNSQMPIAETYFRQLTASARKFFADNSAGLKRPPLTAAIAQSHKDDRIGQFLDILMLNRYYGWYENEADLDAIERNLAESLKSFAAKFNNSKPLLLSEFGAEALSGSHCLPIREYCEEYQKELLAKHHFVFDQLYKSQEGIRFIGELVWNFADFNTHQSITRVSGNNKGIFTADRRPKAAASLVAERYKRLSRGTIEL